MSSEPKIIRAACLAVFQDKKIMMVRGDDKKVFFFVGGGLEDGESDVDCLIREVREEIGCELDMDSIRFLAEFEDDAFGRENTIVQLPFYTAKLIGVPSASSEIEEISFFDSSCSSELLSVIAVNKVFPWLREQGYIE